MQGLHAAYACLARVVVVLSLALGALTAAPAHASSATADPVSQDAAPRAAPAGPPTLTGDWFGYGPQCAITTNFDLGQSLPRTFTNATSRLRIGVTPAILSSTTRLLVQYQP